MYLSSLLKKILRKFLRSSVNSVPGLHALANHRVLQVEKRNIVFQYSMSEKNKIQDY